MKAIIKKIVLPSIFLVAISTQVSAQTRRSSTTINKTETRTNPTKINTTSRRISSTKVTYKTPQRKVLTVRTLPNKTIVKQNGQNYYYANNKYYTQSRGRYIVIAPKVGFRVNVLPTNYVIVRHNNYNYFNAQGIFYIQTNNAYEVVDPEIGTIVYELPNDYEKVIVDGQTYFEYANILYEKIQINNTRAYEVVGIIEITE
ncbi:hypothetical protein APS56_12560 [Pseudalgibacter alginicilyticus]|uniref:Uncharacterized protein n=1 Tax=Pseudalgibacter alginicilyticus TaxID=1736674 RepID=A0A0P0D6Z8_9FLAO|nr:DUF6515 family protein [Pseudalgibacter alginicilyticus]ALJ05911.1 hypothetical protein APS56_12560 [Pseudalgibacter alginicilyticus]